MTGDARFILNRKSDVLFTPNSFINSDKTGKFVNLGKTHKKTYIKTGLEGEELTEITTGVKEGDTIYD